MRKLLIATRNKGKLPEIQHQLEGLPFECVSLDQVPSIPPDFDATEPAQTLEGNAIIKAVTYGTLANMLTLADDSGLEIDALDGKPGVLSARYANGGPEARNTKVLEEMKDVPEHERTARFRASVAIYDPSSKKLRTCEGVFEGSITEEPLGTGGFGYDPIFRSNALGKTNAEVSLEEKNSISHRGDSLKKARELLQHEF